MSKITIEKTDLQSRDKKITDQQSEITKLKEQLASNEGGDLGGGSKRGSAFTREDQDILGELYEPMKKLVEASVGGFSVGINKNFGKLNETLTTLQENIKNQNKSLFSGVALSTIDNLSEIKETPEFKDFLETDIEGLDITWADAWADAESKNDIRRLKQILKKVPLPAKAEEEEENVEESNFEPSGGSSSNEMRMSAQFKYKASDLQTRLDEFKRGDIDAEAYETFEKSFNEAVDSGQVLNDLDSN